MSFNVGKLVLLRDLAILYLIYYKYKNVYFFFNFSFVLRVIPAKENKQLQDTLPKAPVFTGKRLKTACWAFCTHKSLPSQRQGAIL